MPSTITIKIAGKALARVDEKREDVRRAAEHRATTLSGRNIPA
jgi:hypothetical protein